MITFNDENNNNFEFVIDNVPVIMQNTIFCFMYNTDNIFIMHITHQAFEAF